MPNHPGYMAYTAIQNERTQYMLMLRALRRDTRRCYCKWAFCSLSHRPKSTIYASERLPGHKYCLAPPKPTPTALWPKSHHEETLENFYLYDFALRHELLFNTPLHKL